MTPTNHPSSCPDSPLVSSILEQVSHESPEVARDIMEGLSEMIEHQTSDRVSALLKQFESQCTEQGFKNFLHFLHCAEKFGSLETRTLNRKPVPVRYRDPANAENTWTGRGKQPKWLMLALKKGKTLDDFSID